MIVSSAVAEQVQNLFEILHRSKYTTLEGVPYVRLKPACLHESMSPAKHRFNHMLSERLQATRNTDAVASESTPADLDLTLQSCTAEMGDSFCKRG